MPISPEKNPLLAKNKNGFEQSAWHRFIPKSNLTIPPLFIMIK